MFDDFIEILADNPFEEKPVDAKTFVESSEYLNQPPLSKIQYDSVEAMSQIYKKEDLQNLMGNVEGSRYYAKYTKNEIILQLGKGSGKDHMSTVAVAYVVYKLLCLKDPARYFGKPPGDAIDIINIAINAAQAKNVFFKGFKTKIEKSPWFAGKYYAKMDSIEFDKAITVYSGHSERESHEGLNLFIAVLDEISGFATEVGSGNDQGKTASNIYKAFRGTVDSRFPDLGKVVLLSFPRYPGDFISSKYEEAILEKDVIYKTHKFILNPDLPEEQEGNSFEISWEEDQITAYKYPGIFALKRPTWEVNPTRRIEDFKLAFYTDLGDAMMRFLCVPTYASDAFFKQRDKVQNAMTARNPIDNFRRFDPTFKPDPEKIYFVHADLAQRHDKCAVAIAHVDKWVSVQVMKDYQQVSPVVVVDAVAWWEPRVEGPVDLSEVKQWIQNLRRVGFNIGRVSFDRWQCLPGHSLVHTPNGPVKMENIVPGDEVITRFGKSAVTSKVDSGEQEVFRITTRLGYEFEGTANHKMLTREGWKTISELTETDELLLSSKHEWNGEDKISPRQAYVLGALVADGWINDNGNNQIGFVSADKVFSERFNKFIVEDWGFKNKVQVSVRKIKNHHKEVYDYRYWDKQMILKMREAGLKVSTSRSKSIPHSVLSGSEEVRAAFLSGYIDGDGGAQHYTNKNNPNKRSRISCDTSSEQLISELVWLSNSLGLEPTRLRQFRGDRGFMHRVTFEGRKAERLLSVIDLSIPRKSKISIERSKEVKERWTFSNDELWLKIRKVESVGVMQTYDISVPEYEEFLANSFVTHNSFDIQNELKAVGMRTDTVSVAKKHYEDMAMLIYEERLIMPAIDLLFEELTELKIMNNNRVDHPRKKSKDLADAVCGAVFGAISHTPRNTDMEIEIHTFKDRPKSQIDLEANNVIDYKPKPMPDDIRDYLDRFGLV
jgi:intein/homing endonuclease